MHQAAGAAYLCSAGSFWLRCVACLFHRIQSDLIASGSGVSGRNVRRTKQQAVELRMTQLRAAGMQLEPGGLCVSSGRVKHELVWLV